MRTYATSTNCILMQIRMYSVYLCVYNWIHHPGTFTGTFTGIFSQDLYFSSNLMLLYTSRCIFFESNATVDQPIYTNKIFSWLSRGSQLSNGFEINEDILRYAAVCMLIYYCFLTCNSNPLERWLPHENQEIILFAYISWSMVTLFSIFRMGKKMREMQFILSVNWSVLSTNQYIQVAYILIQDYIYVYKICISGYIRVRTRRY